MSDDTETSFEDTDHDVFDDSEEVSKATDDTEETKEEASEEKSEETKSEGSEKSDEPGEKQESDETPSEETKEDEEDQSDEKMVPAHRLKAAVKDVTDKLDAANAEIAKLTAQPVPDHTQDPDGYSLHVRMETSKAVMRSTHEDYNEVIAHYQEMAKINPTLNQVVASNEIPAKIAYDIAKKDMEIRELEALRDSPDWKEFEEFKKNKVSKEAEAAKAAKEAKKAEAKKPVEEATKVPNLNRATESAPTGNESQYEDEDLFAGAL